MAVKQKVLTGITTSGTPHLGNLVGAILPAIEASKGKETSSFFVFFNVKTGAVLFTIDIYQSLIHI